jgi:hypothetical protein
MPTTTPTTSSPWVPAIWMAAVNDVVGFFGASAMRRLQDPYRSTGIYISEPFVTASLNDAMRGFEKVPHPRVETLPCLCRHEALICACTHRRVKITGEHYDELAVELCEGLREYLAARN